MFICWVYFSDGVVILGVFVIVVVLLFVCFCGNICSDVVVKFF